MAGTQIIIDSEQILAIATQMENDNNELKQLLTDSKTTIDNLANVWTGQAADETRTAYESFAGKFFQQYFDILEQYVKFLRRNVAEQYTETEQANVKLADAFK